VNEPAVPTNRLTADWVVGVVLSNNPSLLSARAGAEALQERVTQERAWMDPRVGVDFERMGTTEFDEFTDAEWMVGQEIPLSGRNVWRGRAARAEAAAGAAEVRRKELDLVARARAAFYRYADAQTQLEINRQAEEILGRFVEVSRLKYEAGGRSQADLLMARTELAKNSEARRDLERMWVEAQSELNVLMDRAAQMPLPPPEPLQELPFVADLERMQAQALAHRPEFETVRRRIEAAKARRSEAKRAWIPDPEVRFEVRHYADGGGGIQEYDTGVFFSLPWVNARKYKAAIREADRLMESAEHELNALRTETLGMIRMQLQRIDTSWHHYRLFRDQLLPLARQTVKAAEIAYSNGQGTLLELLSAQRTSQDLQARQQTHLMEHLSALAGLAAMTGAEGMPGTGSVGSGKE
jgi:outer membrane protein TolC